jgi:hypothetical protein
LQTRTGPVEDDLPLIGSENTSADGDVEDECEESHEESQDEEKEYHTPPQTTTPTLLSASGSACAVGAAPVSATDAQAIQANSTIATISTASDQSQSQTLDTPESSFTSGVGAIVKLGPSEDQLELSMGELAKEFGVGKDVVRALAERLALTGIAGARS